MHHLDPNVDAERTYILASLKIKNPRMIRDGDPLLGLNSTGDGFSPTDGRPSSTWGKRQSTSPSWPRVQAVASPEDRSIDETFRDEVLRRAVVSVLSMLTWSPG